MLSEVLEEMVPVLLSVAVHRLLAGVLHQLRGFPGWSPSLWSLLLTTTCVSIAVMPTCSPGTPGTQQDPRQGWPLEGRPGSLQRSPAHEGSALKGSLSPVTNVIAVRDPRDGGYL